MPSHKNYKMIQVQVRSITDVERNTARFELTRELNKLIYLNYMRTLSRLGLLTLVSLVKHKNQLLCLLESCTVCFVKPLTFTSPESLDFKALVSVKSNNGFE